MNTSRTCASPKNESAAIVKDVVTDAFRIMDSTPDRHKGDCQSIPAQLRSTYLLAGPHAPIRSSGWSDGERIDTIRD